MPTVSMLVCPPASIAVATDSSGNQYMSCADGAGSIQNVVIEEPFDPAMLNSSELGGAFGAGFIVMGTGLVIVWSAKQIMRAIRGALT